MTEQPHEQGQQELFRMDSFRQWCDHQWKQLDKDEIEPVPRIRGAMMAGEMPGKFQSYALTRMLSEEARRRLRQEGRKTAGDGTGRLLLAEQMELPDLQGFLMTNFDRRGFDIRSELAFVAAWCGKHTGWTIAKVYKATGLPVPKESQRRELGASALPPHSSRE